MCIGCKAYCALNAPSAPAGLGLYWIVSNIYQIMQLDVYKHLCFKKA
jgi:hypothetical protein